MRDFVVATAGHVDHGKSALVRAVTGIEPDRLAEEHRRGLTVDLGFAWLRLDGAARHDQGGSVGAGDGGVNVAFVDVPGHERFLGNMLSGLGPAPVVCFVIAADEGWQAQASDHRDAVAALGIADGLIVITKADLAGAEQILRVRAQAREQLAGTGLAGAPVVVCSARTGQGLDELRSELATVLDRVPPAPEGGRVRLWVDRSFSITGAGTVVTGTLSAATLAREDELLLAGRGQWRKVTVRGLQSGGHEREEVGPVSRVAVNLRGLSAQEVHRGDVLLAGDWPRGSVVDVRRVHGLEFAHAGEQVSVHVGSASVPGRIRAFDGEHARLMMERALPLVVGDPLVLQASSRRVRAGVVVLDVAPPALRRRGAGARRAAELADMPAGGDPAGEVFRRGAVRLADLVRWGVSSPEVSEPSAAALPGVDAPGVDAPGVEAPGGRAPGGRAPGGRVPNAGPPSGVRELGRWWVAEERYQQWLQRLRDLVAEAHQRDPLAAGVSPGAVAGALDLPDTAMTERLPEELAEAAGFTHANGLIADPARVGSLDTAGAAVADLEQRLRHAPFDAPEADDLTELGLGPRELAAADRLGRLLRLPGAVILLPNSPALAMRELARLPQPFTASAAKAALGTTRRVAIPLLEHLDTRGWTRQLPDSRREVVR